LSNNNLATLTPGVFEGLDTLRSLFLDCNALTIIPSGVFVNIPSLSSLNLASNGLRSISPGAFAGMTSMKSLELDSNHLTTIDPDVFNDTTRIDYLSIQSNSIQSLNDDAFAYLYNLEELNLNNNQLTSLPSGIFDMNTNLDTLYLNNNRLTSLPNGVFNQLNSLASLELNSNSLIYVDIGYAHPEFIDLQSNYLAFFHQDSHFVNDKTLGMKLYLDNNCLISSNLPPYNGPNVDIYMGDNQGRCSYGVCSKKEMRESGCFMCSNGGSGGECMTCLENRIVFNGRCVECLASEKCPFNNSGVVYCVDDKDLSHCSETNPINCTDHVCVYGVCGNKIVEGIEECDSTEHCGSDCKCVKGYVPKSDKSGICVLDDKSDSSSSRKKVDGAVHTHFEITTLIICVVISLFFI